MLNDLKPERRTYWKRETQVWVWWFDVLLAADTRAAIPVCGSPHGVALVTVAGVVPHWAQQNRRQAAFRRSRLSVGRRANGARVLTLCHLLRRGVTLVG